MVAGKDSHPVIDVRRDAVIAQDLAQVAQTTGFALYDEQPKRIAGGRDQVVPGTLVVDAEFRPVRALLVERRQVGERLFQCTAKTAEAARTLLCEFVLKDR